MRLENVVVDARDPLHLGRWWAEALGAEVIGESAEEVDVNLPGCTAASGPWPDLVFVPVDEPEAGRQRVHLDLASASVAEQEATVARLEAMGARRVDVGQPADAPWVVLADPEGNPFCVLGPRDRYRGVGALAAVTVAVPDPRAVRDLWAAATGWDVAQDEADAVRLRRPDGRGPALALLARSDLGDDPRKDRIHLDVRPGPADDQGEVVARLTALGARPFDAGQRGDAGWVVLADPEGTVLCVLAPG